jgi:hypothetical protein
MEGLYLTGHLRCCTAPCASLGGGGGGDKGRESGEEATGNGRRGVA